MRSIWLGRSPEAVPRNARTSSSKTSFHSCRSEARQGYRSRTTDPENPPRCVLHLSAHRPTNGDIKRDLRVQAEYRSNNRSPDLAVPPRQGISACLVRPVADYRRHEFFARVSRGPLTNGGTS